MDAILFPKSSRMIRPATATKPRKLHSALHGHCMTQAPAQLALPARGPSSTVSYSHPLTILLRGAVWRLLI